MIQNDTSKPNKSARRERAAHLVAEDKLSDELIAAEVGVKRLTIARWKTQESFKNRVAEIVEEVRAALTARNILNREKRLASLEERQRLMTEVIRQRAVNLKDVPGGGNTGLLVRQVKGIGKGEDFQVVEEYAVDTGLLRELREHEKQAAIELGEWTEKQDVTSGGARLTFTLKLDNAGSFENS